MEPISEINRVHAASLKDSYEKIARYLKTRQGNYLGSVYGLEDSRQSLVFQSECLVPHQNQDRTRILCLFSNAHPESIRRGMFHFAESGVARLWTDFCATGYMNVTHAVLQSPSLLRECCLNVQYAGPFAFAFACYWIFPTPHPKDLLKLFGPLREPPGFENTNQRLNVLLSRWHPHAIISFNGEAFEDLVGIPSKGYLEKIQTGLFIGEYTLAESTSYKVFQTYPAAWRFHKDADRLRQDSLRRIKQKILSGL